MKEKDMKEEKDLVSRARARMGAHVTVKEEKRGRCSNTGGRCKNKSFLFKPSAELDISDARCHPSRINLPPVKR